MSFIIHWFIVVLLTQTILLYFRNWFFYFPHHFIFLFLNLIMRLVQYYCFSLINLFLFMLNLHFVWTFRLIYFFESFFLGFKSFTMELNSAFREGTIRWVWNTAIVEKVIDRRRRVWVVQVEGIWRMLHGEGIIVSFWWKWMMHVVKRVIVGWGVWGVTFIHHCKCKYYVKNWLYQQKF